MFIFQIALEQWLKLSPAQLEDFESKDFTFEDLLGELHLKFN